MNLALSEPQAEFFTSTSKSIAAVAGFGSGKTDIAMIRLFSTMFQYPGYDMLYLAPTFPLIKDIWYPKVEEFLTTMGIKYKINRQENTIIVGGCGSVFCRTMEHPSRIIGFEVLDAFLDELDVLPTDKALEVWRKSKARCRQKCPTKSNQMYLTTTPEGFKATYRLFKKDPIPGSHLVQMSTYSNEHNLPDDYIDELRNNYPEQLIEAYINGQFVNLTAHTVYYGFNRATCTIAAKDFSLQKSEKLYIGNDFNIGKMAAAISVIRNNQVVVFDEIVKGRDTPDMIAIIKERYPDNAIVVCPDSSGKNRSTSAGSFTLTDHALLREAGFLLKAGESNPLVRNRVGNVNLRFQQEKLLVVDSATWLIACLEEMAYTSEGLPDKQNDYDHITDALGYLMWQVMPAVTKISGSWSARPYRVN